MSDSITIDNKKIGNNYPPYIIAEMSANHNGSLKNALKIIDMAKTSGADAVKLQTYLPDTLTIDISSKDFIIEGGLWDGQTLYELYQSAYMPWEWHKPLFEHAKNVGISIFSSPFDNSAVDLLEDLNCPAYKIASFESVDLALIKYVAKTGKPMIISTGMANKEEIQEAIETAKEGGCEQLSILHCVSGYPAPAVDYNLKTIVDMKKSFNLITGLSDHTTDNATAIASVALGASIIEKHVTLDRNGGGPDDSFSLEAKELKELCFGTKKAWESLGTVNYSLKSSENASVKFRRSIYFIKDIKKGEKITKDHVKIIRPGYGIAPKYLKSIIGKKSKVSVFRGSPVTKKNVEF